MRLQQDRRSGVAAVEFAFLLPLLMLLIIGTWEAGRAIQAQQILVNAAREGARLAAQAQIINLEGDYTQIKLSVGTPNVRQVVTDYLRGAGIGKIDEVTVEFEFIDGDTGKTEPWEGAKNQRFRVTVSMPYENVRITGLNLMNYETLRAQADWVCMADDPFTVNTTIPTWSPIP